MIPPDAQVLTAAEVAELARLSESTVRKRVKKYGHILGVQPIPDVGARWLFSRILIERAFHGVPNESPAG